MIRQTFKVEDMSCTNCAMKLESLEDSLDGVKEINASYHKLTMVVQYDESKLTEEQIVAASLDLARQFTPSQVPQPPQVERPGEPWSYGVLGPDVE